MENNKNKKPVKFQGDMLNFCDFIQIFVFTQNHHLNINIKHMQVRLTIIDECDIYPEVSGLCEECGLIYLFLYLLYDYILLCIMEKQEIITLICSSIGTAKNNKFSICSKWKIHYF